MVSLSLIVLVRHNPSNMFLLGVEEANTVVITVSRVASHNHNPSSLFTLAIVTKVELKLTCSVRIVVIIFFRHAPVSCRPKVGSYMFSQDMYTSSQKSLLLNIFRAGAHLPTQLCTSCWRSGLEISRGRWRGSQRSTKTCWKTK